MNFLSRLWRQTFFTDMNPILKLGAHKSLEAEDLPPLPTELDPETLLIQEQEIQWTESRFLKSLLWASRRLWYWPTGLHLADAGASLLGPVLVNHFIKLLQTGVSTQTQLIEALSYGLGIGLSGIFAGLMVQHYFYHRLKRQQVLINVVNTKIFRHALALSRAARDQIAIGDIVNHMSSDTESVSEGADAISELIYCTVMILGAIGLLFHYLGSTAWVAVLLLGALAPITRKVSREFTRFDEELMKHRDSRVSLMSQILGAIRVLKYFAWEKSVCEEVQAIRNKELESRRRIARAELFVTLIYVSVGTLVLFSVLSVHVWRGGVLDPALIFTCVSLFALLEEPFAFISRVISMFISANVAAGRISRFLAQPEIGSEVLKTTKPGLALELNQVSAQILKGVTLEINEGESLALVGPVGSGKSTLLNVLLGEVNLTVGAVQCQASRIGYVSQEAYILNGTLLENLVFGQIGVLDSEVAEALRLTQLKYDVAQMSGGLQTEIGEKGVNLSGGQKQRLSLARAYLHKPDLVLLDDPLSAVDSSTEQALVDDLVFGAFKNITRLVVTHRLAHLGRFDRIAFMNEGRIEAIGTFEELLASSPGFKAYMDEFARTEGGGSLKPEAASNAAENILPSVIPLSASESRITEDEDRSFGAVKGGVYWQYVLSLGGTNKNLRPWLLILLLLAAGSGTVFPLAQKAWLAHISEASSGVKPLTAIYVYGLLGLLVMGATLASDLFWLKRGLRAGRDIHDQMLNSILGTGVRFFDSTPVGRVLQRFSRDMEAIDIQLQWCFENSVKCLVQVIVTLALIVTTLPLVIVFIVPVLILYYREQKLYRSSAREVKRLDSIARSPRFAHFKETLQGLTVIRAYGKQQWFMGEFFKRLHHSQRMFYGHFMVNRWFSARVPVIGGMVSLFTAVAIVLSVRSHQISPGLAGLLTVYSLSFWGVLNWGIRIWSEVEARMTSMERVKFYSNLPQELSVSREPQFLGSSWPLNGTVEFENVKLRYAEHLPLVLKGLSFKVEAGQKVGIIGRTGSGKSTLFQALYRFIELESGRILIDGVDIATLPLSRLRKALAIIPQDPTLFMGTLRSNLDRYEEFSDEALWQVLKRTCLEDFVRSLPLGLNSLVVENGGNLSQGQRQLLCLARALLVQASVIILDEATASVDVKTDALVQKVVRESSLGVTILIIAHRLGTVRDCDQILEISNGQRLNPADSLCAQPNMGATNVGASVHRPNVGAPNVGAPSVTNELIV